MACRSFGVALAALSSLVNRRNRNPSWALGSSTLAICVFVCAEGRQEKWERAAVPGTAALSGCCYFNPPAGQRAQPEDQPVEGLVNGPQILNLHQRSPALVLLGSLELFASLEWHRRCLECHRVPRSSVRTLPRLTLQSVRQNGFHEVSLLFPECRAFSKREIVHRLPAREFLC
jgi:hypothetical protein